jgi:hypothetical protein
MSNLQHFEIMLVVAGMGTVVNVKIGNPCQGWGTCFLITSATTITDVIVVGDLGSAPSCLFCLLGCFNKD